MYQAVNSLIYNKLYGEGCNQIRYLYAKFRVKMHQNQGLQFGPSVYFLPTR